MVMEIGMMMMKMEMATHCAQECQFLIKRIDIKYTPSGTCKNCCTLATTVCGRTFNAVLAKNTVISFLIRTYRQVAKTIMRRQLAENCEWWKVAEKAMKMEPKERRGDFWMSLAKFCVILSTWESSKLIEYKKRIKKFMKLGFNLALIEKSAARTNFWTENSWWMIQFDNN